MKPDLGWLTLRPIAHRGRHDGNKQIWENTLSAFSYAIEQGFSIECDIHYARDGVAVVFHDDDLERLCNIKGDVRDKTSGELGLMAIGGTGDKIPTLKQLLDLTKGRVPLVLELKGRKDDDDGFVDTVLEVLQSYDGQVALMSFDPWLLKDMKALHCPHPIGLTAEGTQEHDFETHLGVMEMGLDFISYNQEHLPNAFITSQRNLSISVITWTVRTKAQADHGYAHAEQITFEGFDP